jgi:hypothetical protein
MGSEEFADDLTDTVRRHAGEIDADDLMRAADELARIAERWESTEVDL